MIETTAGTACATCGRRLVDLFAARREDIGAEGWAHYGALNAAEFDSIEAERDRIWQHTAAVASGAGIDGAAPGMEESAQ